MAFEKPILKQGFKAAADMSGATCQFCFVEINSSSEVSLCNGATDLPVGVLQNRPASGETAEVLVLGISKVRANADLSIGNLIGTASNGEADAKTVGTDTTEYIVGRVIAIEASVNTDGYVTAFINCLTPARAV